MTGSFERDTLEKKIHVSSRAVWGRLHAMKEIIFVVEEAGEGGFVARALGASIVTEADDLSGLQERVRDAVRCHFDEAAAPKVIRLHFVRDQVIPA